MWLVQGAAALQRRARMELSAAQVPREGTEDLRKWFASLRCSQIYVGWRKQRALVKVLNSLLTQIETVIAPQDADDALELLWSFLKLAPSIHERSVDSNGSVGEAKRYLLSKRAYNCPRLHVPILRRGSLLEPILTNAASKTVVQNRVIVAVEE